MMDNSTDNRIILKKDSEIRLLPYVPQGFSQEEKGGRPDAGQPDVFKIVSVEGKGSSAICYKAVKQPGAGQPAKRGVLKEFYPVDIDENGFKVHMERSAEDDGAKRNQLYAKFGTFGNFSLLRKSYENSYAILTEKRSGDSFFADDLNKYIPNYSYYCGIPAQPENDALDSEIARDNVSFYVWVENEAGYRQFQEYLDILCREMQQADEKNGWVDNRIRDLDYIIRCILELTKCVHVLHRFCLYHLDLHPKNFGVQLYDADIDMDSARINLYDTNSLLYGRAPNQLVFSSGTTYFRSREVIDRRTKDCGIQSDIYSIGTILFYALVIRNVNGKYRNVHFCEGMEECSRKAYEDIPLDLIRSELLQSSDETRNSLIFEKLTKIIRKALNRFDDPCGTYETAGELADDLESILRETGLKQWIAAQKGKQATVLLEDSEDIFDKQYGASGTIEKLLFTKPLYDYFRKDKAGRNECGILVIGCGTYSSEFIDFALELSQGMDCPPQVTVLTQDHATQKKTYLDARPALPEFFEVDGQPAKHAAIQEYGSLSFRGIEFDGRRPDTFEDTLRGVLGNKKYSYVFIALNDDGMNRAVAEACRAFVYKKSLISYVQYNAGKNTAAGNLVPVSVNEVLKDIPEYSFLRRMALNIHLLWMGIGDLENALRQFRTRYNFNSSMESALSVKYKLHSVGIRLDTAHPEKAARELLETLKDNTTVKALVQGEHARWNVEKITDGMRTMEDVSSLRTKTKTEKEHPSLLPCGRETPLKTPYWCDDRRARWDDPEADLSMLDPLDGLSVRLHLHWRDVVEDIRTGKNTRLDDARNALEKSLGDNQKLLFLFDSLNQVINTLLREDHNNTGSVDRYFYLLTQMRREAGAGRLDTVKDRLKALDEEMLPVREYRLYTDWRGKDEKLIVNLPFILTYSTSIHLCIPFYYAKRTENNTSLLFSNIASALIVNPKQITYVIDGDPGAGDAAGLADALNYAVNTIKAHGLQTEINAVLVAEEKNRGAEPFAAFLSEVEGSLSKERIKRFEPLYYRGWEKTDALRQFLMQDGNPPITAIESNDTAIAGGLLCAARGSSAGRRKKGGKGPENEIPFYSFDPISQSFQTTDGCDFLPYILHSSFEHRFIYSDDLYVARGKEFRCAKPESYSAYRIVWNLYNGNSSRLSRYKKECCRSAWKEICQAVGKNDVTLANLEKSGPESDDRGTGCYEESVPLNCVPFLDRFLREVKSSPFAFLKNYRWRQDTAESKLLTIDSPTKSLRRTIDKLLQNREKISQPDRQLTVTEHAGGYFVIYHPLEIKGVKVPRNSGEPHQQMLRILEEEKLIRSLSITDDASDKVKVSFRFPNTQIARLFSQEGYLLELHTYYDSLESGYFDDASIGVEVVWNEYGVKNEFDVVLTKGFRTITVEAKARDVIEAENYYKLYPLAKTFGVNTIPVLLVDLDGRSTRKIELEIRRGNELGIRTIVASENIAEQLNALLEE